MDTKKFNDEDIKKLFGDLKNPPKNEKPLTWIEKLWREIDLIKEFNKRKQ